MLVLMKANLQSQGLDSNLVVFLGIANNSPNNGAPERSSSIERGECHFVQRRHLRSEQRSYGMRTDVRDGVTSYLVECAVHIS
jgi:hypothetical protein